MKSTTLVLLIFIILLSSSFLVPIGLSASKENIVVHNFHLACVDGRFFLWAQPASSFHENGYPVIFLFHGAAQHAFSWIIPWNQWNRNQAQFTTDALDQGFFIICLESERPIRPGPRAWDVFEKNSSENTDLLYTEEVVLWLKSSSLNIDLENIFCTGFSSGAFMCSRIGLSQEDVFNAIALNSGCNADSITLTMRGPIFDLNKTFNLSIHHPPTLILHGQQDQLVPVECGINYYNDLQKANVLSSLLIDPEQGHIWLKDFNQEILDWFSQHMV
jgi:poly(3-hydroxybutyrate) depolymerase